MKNNINQLLKKGKTLFTGLAIFSLVFASLAIAPPAEAALVPGGAVGPVINAGIGQGFPAWYMDQNGLALEIMEAADGFGISAAPTPGFGQTVGFGAEGFYWAAEASLDNGLGQTALLVTALEAAFAGESAVDGEQSVFARIRVDAKGVTPGETYTFTHPFGTISGIANAAGEVKETSDIGCFALGTGISSCDPNTPPGNPNNFSLALQGGVGPFLTWDTFNLNPALTDPLLVNVANPTKRYIGNPNVEHTITAGPNGSSFSIAGAGFNASTNLFAVVGRIAVVDVTPPTIVSVTPATAALSAVNTVLSAAITDDLGVRTATVDLGALGNNLSATLNGSQEVPASASTATGSGTFTIDTTANTLSFNITTTGIANETAAHIHGPAAAGANALPIFDLPLGASKIGTWTYPENMEADILAGRTYVNVHTALRPDGDIRGQILPVANVQNLELTTGTNTNGTWGIVIPSFNRVGTFSLPITVSDGSNITTLNHSLIVNTLASVSVAPATATIVGAGTQQLTASPLDNNGAAFVGATITWASDNTAVATVDQNGLVTGVLSQTPGTATITATAVSGATTVTGSSVISVSPGLPVLTTVNVTPNPASIVVNAAAPAGQTLQLAAATLDQFGVPFVGATVTWASSDPLIATVDQNGLVTTVIPGQVTITATASDGALPTPTTASGTTIVTITTAPQVATSVSVTPATATLTGGTQQLTATELDQFSGPMAPQPASFTWTSSNTAVATVDTTGLVTATGAGTATITAASGALSGTSAITVNAVLTSINVTPNPATAVINATLQMTATGMDQFGVAMAVQPTFTWTSSDALAAAIDSAAGLATAGANPGTATITATSGLLNGTSSLTVTAVPQVLTSISVTPATASIITGATQQFTASALDQFGSPMIPQPAITFSSSDTAVATVNATGLASGIIPGTATITAASGAVSGTAALTVTLSPPVLTTLSVTPATSSIAVGATQQLAALPLDQRNDPFVGAAVATWTSSNPLVATVDANGMVSGLTAGTAVITASIGLITGQANVSVPFALLATNLPDTISSGGGSIFTLPALASATSTPSVTFALPLNLNISSDGLSTSTVAIPSGTIITKTDGANLDATTISAGAVAATALSNLGNFAVNGAVQWGIPSVGLQFSQPINISIFVGAALDGQTLSILRSITGSSDWTSDGIVAPATSVVSNGFVNFQATKASFFAAATPVAPPAPAPAPAPSSGGGGGGGVGPISLGGNPGIITLGLSTPGVTPTPFPSAGQVLGEQTIAEGALIRAIGDIDVYIVKLVGGKKFKRLILSPSVFNSYGHLRWEDILDIEQSVVDSFMTNDLVRAVGDTKVYKLSPSGDTGVKQWITTAEVFNSLGLDWDAIYEVNETDLNSYTTGANLN